MLLVSSLVAAGSSGAASGGGGAGAGPPPSSLIPSPGNLPGTQILQSLADGLDGWALIAAGIGIVIGAIMWAFGNYSQNWQQAYNGRRGVIVSALAALLIGGASHIINFFLAMGSRL